MATTLLQLWQDQPSFFEGKSFRQVIQVAGDGRLRDANRTSVEVQEWLAEIPISKLRSCIAECLDQPFEEGGFALQDCANEIGQRLGFDVTPGKYRGVKGEVGNDGLWRSGDGFALLIEVKTTDAYRVNLDTVAGYREKLIADEQISRSKSSIVIAVGRQDTGDLEAQIRGSRHAWDIRLISIEALLRLAEIKEELSDPETSRRINQILRPVEYTRLDEIVQLLFAAKKELVESAEVVPVNVEPDAVANKLSPSEFEAVRDRAVAHVGKKLKCAFKRVGRAVRISADGTTGLVCIASQRYKGPSGSGNYWFGFTPSQKDCLSQSKAGWVALVCADNEKCYLVPWSKFLTWIPELWTTPASPSTDEEIRHWHVYFNDFGDRVELAKSGGGNIEEISQYRLK